MGTPEFALPSLEALNRSGDDLLGVVTQPDRPKGRGGFLSPPPIKPAAIKMGCDVYQPEKVREKDFINRIRGLKPDLIVVVAFGQILPKDIIDIPLCGCVNVHASMLPKYRGAAPVNWAIINGDERTGVTTMMMDAGMDTGPILLQQEAEIYEEDTAGSLLRRLGRLGAELLLETIGGIRENRIIPRPQGEAGVSYAPILKKGDGLINWGLEARRIERLIKGLDPWPCCYTFYEGNRWRLFGSSVLSREDTGIPGRIEAASEDKIIVQTGRGKVSVAEIQPEGKRRMKVSEYLTGHHIEKGIILGNC